MSGSKSHSLPINPFSGVRSFLVLDVLNEANQLAAEGYDVIHMEAGQPSLGAPEAALKAGEEALRAVRLGYTEACGRPSLRQTIAEHHKNYYGHEISSDQVIVTTGSSAAFTLAFLSLAAKHKRMALPVPGYPAYRSIASAYGIEVVDLPAGQKNGWMPDAKDIRALHEQAPLDAILVASPNNPTGKTLSKARRDEIIAVCEELGIWIISDEIYHGITFENKEETLVAHTENAIVINSFSKYYGMTGWRIGWMVVPPVLARKLETLAQHLFISPPTLSQIVAEAALKETEELDARVAHYRENRDILVAGLKAAGFGDVAPVEGAFYAYVNIAHLSNDSIAFARELLHDTGVATTPGLDFDTSEGSQYIRLSFAESKEKIQEAVARIAGWMKDRRA